MSDDDWGFAPPPFNADNTLQQIKRSLRDLKLTERGQGFELKGKPVVELALDGGGIAVKLARRLSMTPEWDQVQVRSGADQRKLLDDVKRRLDRWQRED